MPRVRGTVISWKDRWGFVKSDASPRLDSVFLHASDVEGDVVPCAGMRLSYVLAIDPRNKKWRAYSAKPLASSSAAAEEEFEGHKVSDLIAASRRMLGILRREADGEFMTAAELQIRMPPPLQHLAHAALDYDFRRAEEDQHFQRQPRIEPEFQAKHASSKRKRAQSTDEQHEETDWWHHEDPDSYDIASE